MEKFSWISRWKIWLISVENWKVNYLGSWIGGKSIFDWWTKNLTEMICVLYNKEQISLASYMIKYFKQRPPDCTLFSEDNCKILIHKELLYQTEYMRSMIKSATIGCCCSQIEIMCPSLTINELEIIVQFLYRFYF